LESRLKVVDLPRLRKGTDVGEAHDAHFEPVAWAAPEQFLLFFFVVFFFRGHLRNDFINLSLYY
jgi:hypothetical protein